jgi:signal peptidase II
MLALMRFLPVLLSLIWIAFDQWVKAIVVASYQLYEQRNVIPGVLDFRYVINTGGAWSLLEGQATLLSALRLVVGLAIMGYLAREAWRKQPLSLTSFALATIAGGAVGNGIDGVRLGHVTDMLQWHQLDQVWQLITRQPFPIFNVADCGVVGGAIALVIANLLQRPAAPAPPPAHDQGQKVESQP